MNKTKQVIRVFNNRHPLVGPTFWIVSIQYFITQWFVGLAWPQPFTLSVHLISDLGNTACGEYFERFVCSPEHGWMNASFVVLGLTMVSGSALIYQNFRQNFGSLVGFTLMAIAGLGTIMVGIFPENTIGSLHFVGALLPFLFGNIALIVLGLSLDLPRLFKLYTIASGVLALIALVLFQSGIFLGLGAGGMERIVAYPQTIWLIAFGFYVSGHRFKSFTSKAMASLR